MPTAFHAQTVCTDSMSAATRAQVRKARKRKQSKCIVCYLNAEPGTLPARGSGVPGELVCAPCGCPPGAGKSVSPLHSQKDQALTAAARGGSAPRIFLWHLVSPMARPTHYDFGAWYADVVAENEPVGLSAAVGHPAAPTISVPASTSELQDSGVLGTPSAGQPVVRLHQVPLQPHVPGTSRADL